jgi:hypothetical protein
MSARETLRIPGHYLALFNATNVQTASVSGAGLGVVPYPAACQAVKNYSPSLRPYENLA